MESLTFKAMGTTISLQINHDSAAQLLEEAKRRLLDYEKRFSANHSQSQLMQLNQVAGKKPMEVDADLFELIAFGKEYSIDTSTTLNIAIGPLIKLWKIGFKNAQVPTDEEIQERLRLIDPQNITLDALNYSVYLEVKGMEIDLGALAKGYFADKIKDYFKEMGVEKGIIDLGGNVLLIGEHPQHDDGYWRVGIQDPFQSRHTIGGVLKSKDKSVVTSGIYERMLTYNGEEYHHIFDSRTGYPIKNDLASITIVSNTSIMGELYTTMYYQYNSHKVLTLLEAVSDVEAIIITRSGQVSITSGLREDFTIIK